jgi:hypothetical protein
MSTIEEKDGRVFEPSPTGRLCPFVYNPLEGCLCLKMGSQNIDSILYYCGGGFDRCDLYRNYLISSGRLGSGDLALHR